MISRCIGILGGMSPQSTIAYYDRIVRHHVATIGDHSYPRTVISSVSFQKYVDWMHAGSWERIAVELSAEIAALARAGADFVLLATNTMHKALPQVNAAVPVLHVLDPVAAELRRRGLSEVAITGTRFTMSDGFYAEGLAQRGFRTVLPAKADRETIHRIIFGELIAGVVTAGSEVEFAAIIRRLRAAGAAAILLGCTELALLVGEDDEGLIDSTATHAIAAWEIAVRRRPLPAS